MIQYDNTEKHLNSEVYHKLEAGLSFCHFAVFYTTLKCYLFESLQDFLPLTEMSEEQLERTGHEGWVVVHYQIEEHPEEHASTLTVQIQLCCLSTESQSR